jgi:hypothetical protein
MRGNPGLAARLTLGLPVKRLRVHDSSVPCLVVGGRVRRMYALMNVRVSVTLLARDGDPARCHGFGFAL